MPAPESERKHALLEQGYKEFLTAIAGAPAHPRRSEGVANALLVHGLSQLLQCSHGHCYRALENPAQEVAIPNCPEMTSLKLSPQ